MKKVMKVIAAGIVCTCIFCFGKAIRDKTAKVYQQFCEETEPEEWIDFNYCGCICVDSDSGNKN